MGHLISREKFDVSPRDGAPERWRPRACSGETCFGADYAGDFSTGDVDAMREHLARCPRTAFRVIVRRPRPSGVVDGAPSDPRVAGIFAALSLNPELETLDVSRCFVADSIALAASVPALRNLSVNEPRLRVADSLRLAEWMASPGFRLAKLDLDGARLSAELSLRVAVAVASTWTLVELRLSGSDVGAAGARALAEAATSKGGLAILHLRRCALGDDGAAALAACLAAGSLRVLKLSENGFTGAAARSFADAVALDPPLRELELSANRVGPGSGVALAVALTSNSTLTTLGLDMCAMECEDCFALLEASAAPGCALRTLEMRWNHAATEFEGLVYSDGIARAGGIATLKFGGFKHWDAWVHTALVGVSFNASITAIDSPNLRHNANTVEWRLAANRAASANSRLTLLALCAAGMRER